MAKWIVVTPDGEETVEATSVTVVKGCLLFAGNYESIGQAAGYAKEEWKSYKRKVTA